MFLLSSNFRRKPEVIPRQISHFMDSRGVVKFVVLWSDLHSNRFSDVPPIWQKRLVFSAASLRRHNTSWFWESLEVVTLGTASKYFDVK